MANMENDPKAKDILDQEIALDDLNAVAGGASSGSGDCVNDYYRNIYGGRGFPNCAATVEDGSWCGSNDACTVDEVIYTFMENCFLSDCRKAWK